MSPVSVLRPFLLVAPGRAQAPRHVINTPLLFHLSTVAEWQTLKNDDGKSLLQLFYEDKKRWGYTFQNAAILTRLKAITAAMKTDKSVVLTERSVLTDKFVFAEMLKDQGLINPLEWQLYNSWYVDV
jgi:deoxyadenosine/deoxycytidine kinase